VNSEITESRVKVRSPLAESEPRPYAIDVQWGTGFELVLGLSAFSEGTTDEARRSYSAGAEWFDEARSKLSADTLAVIAQVGSKACFAELMTLVLDTPLPHDAPATIESLRTISPTRLRRLMLGVHSPNHCSADVPLPVLTAAADGDAGAVRAVIDAADEYHHAFLEHLFSFDASDFKDLLVSAAEGWYDGVLRPDERAVARTLRASARATRALSRRLDPAELVVTVTKGITYRGEPGIARVILVPGIVSRPWTFFSEYDDAKIVAYAVPEEEVTGSAPPEPLVVAYKALGDETRLRILRLLADGPTTLHDLTNHLGLAKSTVHGHLLVLRTGGLITADITADGKGYALRRDGIAESASLLEGFLAIDAPPTTEGNGT
jgi:DNA-binding transcriptional ArsR family regulator